MYSIYGDDKCFQFAVKVALNRKEIGKNSQRISKYIYRRVRDHRHYAGKYRGVAHSICNLKYTIPKEISVLFHNRPNYDYHFKKEIGKEIEGNFSWLGENTEKYKSFLVLIIKEVKRIG